ICKEVFEGDKAFDKLKDHYFQKFLKHDTIHTRYTHDAPQFRDGTECVVCGKYFGHCGSLVRHTLDKCRREDTDGENHREMAIKGIVEPMCYYDVDHHNKQTLRSELAQTLVQESFQDKLLENIGFSLRVHEALGLGCRHFGDSDSDPDDYFNSDEFELACQFIKPWEFLGL
ncbi:hypothetical protein MAR_020541, partial [Mya arenaria]